ncbi:MAG: alpha/beta hydrolase [Pseudomonadota bacterium]
MITDWDDAYANREHIPGAEGYIPRWTAAAAAFRADTEARLDIPYGPRPRMVYDLFAPAETPTSLVVFVHGGYWRAFDKSTWSHLARGALARGAAVAMPSYTLAPQISIAGIAAEVAMAVEAAAAEVPGAIRLAGHSAGGHLVTRLLAEGGGLSHETRGRIARTVSISGVHDLRPLLRTEMNAEFGLDRVSAAAESPALLSPQQGDRVVAWVGGDERPEFIRQTRLLANIWTGLGAEISDVIEAGKHHFDVIDGLEDPESALTAALFG